MIQKANRIQLLDEGASQGYARSLNVVGTNLAATVTGDAGLLTWSGREVLTGARTYYVRTDGSDSNTGLANSSGGAFLTIAKAVAVIGALDLSTFAVTIQLGNTGNYAGFSATAPFIGGPSSSVTLLGDISAPGSYVITSTAAISNGCRMTLAGVDFTPSASDGLQVLTSAIVQIAGACHFGNGARKILVSNLATLTFGAICTMDGNASYWILAVGNSVVSSNGIVHVFSGTPAWAVACVGAQTGAMVSIVNGTPSGAATGKRYDAILNAAIFTNGGGANFFPGDVAGTTATGGQYA